ncbi:MAG: hypothetical protein VZR10_04460 [Methanobrevibacter sp.]|nr:hypothetical protein [Methanobrevibacter sp.]
MKIHLNVGIYQTFYIMRDVNYKLNNPLETRKASSAEINLRWNKHQKVKLY